MADVAVLDVRLHNRTIGTLTRLPDDRNLFAFETDYVDNRDRATLSLAFKDSLGGLITHLPPKQTRLPAFFSNLLPEGALRDYLAERADVKPQREFFLAWVLGRDLSGAVQIVPRDGNSLPPDATQGSQRPAKGDAKQVLRFSLAGVQLKFSAIPRATEGRPSQLPTLSSWTPKVRGAQ